MGNNRYSEANFLFSQKWQRIEMAIQILNKRRYVKTQMWSQTINGFQEWQMCLPWASGFFLSTGQMCVLTPPNDNLERCLWWVMFLPSQARCCGSVRLSVLLSEWKRSTDRWPWVQGTSLRGGVQGKRSPPILGQGQCLDSCFHQKPHRKWSCW